MKRFKPFFFFIEKKDYHFIFDGNTVSGLDLSHSFEKDRSLHTYTKAHQSY